MFNLPINDGTEIILSDTQLSSIFAAGAPVPFAYIAASHENASHAKTVFENFGHTLSKDVFVVTEEELAEKVPCMPDSMKLSLNEKISVKTIGEKFSKLGYARMTKIENENEYSIRGDIIDIWPHTAPHPIRIMLLGDTVEAVKLFDVTNFTSLKNLETCEIAPVPEHCVIDNYQTVSDTLQKTLKTFIRETAKGFRVGFDISAKSSAQIKIKTAPVVNYFSSLSILVPEIVWNVNTRNKTVLIFTGSSRACEKYLETKGIPYNISAPDNFTPNAINVIRRNLGASFELVDENIVIYSLHTPKNAAEPETHKFEKTYGEFTLPEIGGLVIHDQHGLGRYLGIKKMQLNTEERDYIVLQYDGGTFVYLPPERTCELTNYYGPSRRLSRI